MCWSEGIHIQRIIFLALCQYILYGRAWCSVKFSLRSVRFQRWGSRDPSNFSEVWWSTLWFGPRRMASVMNVESKVCCANRTSTTFGVEKLEANWNHFPLTRANMRPLLIFLAILNQLHCRKLSICHCKERRTVGFLVWPHKSNMSWKSYSTMSDSFF